MKGILPVGSVISIKNDSKRYIVIGELIKKDDKIYDYMCVVYPYGFLKTGEFFYYNSNDIKTVFFLGCNNY